MWAQNEYQMTLRASLQIHQFLIFDTVILQSNLTWNDMAMQYVMTKEIANNKEPEEIDTKIYIVYLQCVSYRETPLCLVVRSTIPT